MANTRERRGRALIALQPYIERARTFSGWSLGVDVKHLDPDPPWDYEAIARDRAANAARVIDLGTGGGEVLTRIIGTRRAGVVATEEWHVNAPVARDRLRPLGIPLVRCSSERLPFATGAFDVVIDRHEALDPPDVIRVLGGRGVFMTQQVGAESMDEVYRYFPRRTIFPDHFSIYRQAFEDAGYAVTARLHRYRAAYRTLGDVVFLMLVAPWELPDFDPVAEIDTLLAIEEDLTTPDGIVVMETRYLIEATRD